ncbi:MAG: Flp family type IVb pilin [Rhizobiales bacterium]|nr:Flp family type IVb pilin [Hyphomicrobiales bacterium]
MTKFVRFMKDDSGATAIEYGLIAAAMGVCLIFVMPLITNALISQFTALGAAITSP